MFIKKDFSSCVKSNIRSMKNSLVVSIVNNLAEYKCDQSTLSINLMLFLLSHSNNNVRVRCRPFPCVSVFQTLKKLLLLLVRTSVSSSSCYANTAFNKVLFFLCSMGRSKYILTSLLVLPILPFSILLPNVINKAINSQCNFSNKFLMTFGFIYVSYLICFLFPSSSDH